jgi:hypothetical protein
VVAMLLSISVLQRAVGGMKSAVQSSRRRQAASRKHLTHEQRWLRKACFARCSQRHPKVLEDHKRCLEVRKQSGEVRLRSDSLGCGCGCGPLPFSSSHSEHFNFSRPRGLKHEVWQ